MRPSLRWLNALPHSSRRPQSTSFIGLGRMGAEMANNLFSKQLAASPDSRFVVCDAIPAAAERFCQSFSKEYPNAHISIARTPEEAAQASQTILTMLPSSPQVQTVYNEGIIPALRSLPQEIARDTLVMDSTTLDVSVARQVAVDVIATGAQMVDAPVSGGVTGAKAGTLSFLVGGTSAGFDRSQPILSLMGQRIIYCGPSGAGLAAKICNNLILGIQQIAVGEGMLLGQKLGLDPTILSSVISSSTGGCWSVAVNNPVPKALADKSPPCERDFEGGFATSLMLKDMKLATESAATTGTALPLGQAAEDLYVDAISEMPELAMKDFSSIYRYLQTTSTASRQKD